MKNFEDQIKFSGRDLSPAVTKLLLGLDLLTEAKGNSVQSPTYLESSFLTAHAGSEDIGYLEGEGSSEVTYYFARRVSFESEKNLRKFYNPW